MAAGPTSPAVSACVLRRPRRGAKADSDASLDDPACGVVIAECLRVKGFCVLDGAVGDDVLKQARDAIAADVVKFEQPAVLIQEGLLGMEGSNRISKVAGEALNGTGLSNLDAALTKLSEAVAPYQDECGFRCTTRSRCILHEASEPSIEETDLTDPEANYFCALFMSRKIMIFVPVGPDRGTLELSPYDEEANPTDLTIFPGMAVFVRTDQLSCSFSTRGSKASYVATCYLMQGDILGMHPIKAEPHILPVARELQAWIESRLREIKVSQEDAASDWGEMEAKIPRNFISAANRAYFMRTQTAVRGFAARQPSAWEPEVFCLALTAGCDVVTDVPFCRWDHSAVYDPAPDSWKMQPPKTCCRHAAFYDGIELFDNKMFGLSIAEVRGMDPSQRQVLEVTYDALFKSGMRKNTLTGSTCGMYVGISTSEWNSAERSADVGIFGATGGAPSICAGRLSFCLGCRGASLAVDTEDASSLTSVFWAAESVERKGVGMIQELACAIGVSLILSKSWWPQHSACSFLSPSGRCFTFDASADGYVRAEATACAVVRPKPDTVVDGEEVKDDLPLVGTICGGSTQSSGRSAGMSAPNSAAEQAVLAESCRKSGIMPFDVDIVECHGTGRLIPDACEVASSLRALRFDASEEMLALGALKSNVGNSKESSGLIGLSKVMYSIRWGLILADVHLRQLNPHLDIAEEPALITDETLEPKQSSVFSGVSSYGFGGTLVHVQCWGGVDESLRPPPAPLPEEYRPKLTYWPSGGGHLDSASRPRKGFYIAGTWNCWEPELMKDESEGRYGFTVVMGENCWEQFQIMIDGSESKILHPMFYKAPKSTAAEGPSEFEVVGRSRTWLIDASGPPAVEAASIGDQQQLALPGLAVGGADAGRPGDRYHVVLHVAGKWRAVTWRKLEDAAADALAQPASGSYYISGDFNDWAFEQMSPDTSAPGSCTFDVKITSFGGCRFLIVRNKDWSQTFSPMFPDAPSGSQVYGPDDSTLSNGCVWHIEGKAGSSYTVKFRRLREGGSDVKEITWSRVP